MTPSDLAAIREAEQAATPGPWGLDLHAACRFGVTLSTSGPAIIGDVNANARFIALCRSAVPALLAHVEALEKENARLLGEAAELWDYRHGAGNCDGCTCEACNYLAIDPCPLNPYRSVP